jgi:sugar phosphate isomerase/epimerase
LVPTYRPCRLLEARGVQYSDKGVRKDILAILKDHGFNYVRLHVFNDPTKATPRDRPYSMDGYCDLPHTIEMARRVKAMGILPNSPPQRGGRHIKKDAAKPPLMERTAWSGMRKNPSACRPPRLRR